MGVHNYVAGGLGVAIVLLLVSRQAELKPVLTFTDKATGAWDITLIGFMLKIYGDNREQVKNFYWAKALVTMGIAAFAGGFLAPLTVGHVPSVLMEEAYFWALIFAWYVTLYAPGISEPWSQVVKSDCGKILFSVCFAIFKTNQIVGAIEVGAAAIGEETIVPKSRYFLTPVAAPLLCGFFGGCGGAFLPMTKGLAPIEEGKNWNLKAAFFAVIIYYYSTRACGVDKLTAKMGICLFRMAGEILPAARDKLFEKISEVLYAVTMVKRTSEKELPK